MAQLHSIQRYTGKLNVNRYNVLMTSEWDEKIIDILQYFLRYNSPNT